MDGLASSIDHLSQNDAREISERMAGLNQQQNVNEMVQKLTTTCWEKCIQSSITSNKLSNAEESCARNCVARWFESQNVVFKAATRGGASGVLSGGH